MGSSRYFTSREGSTPVRLSSKLTVFRHGLAVLSDFSDTPTGPDFALCREMSRFSPQHHAWKHWTVRARSPHQPFSDFETARKMWVDLQKKFPDALAAVLMPNHLHLILPTDARVAPMFGLLGGVSKRQRTKHLWDRLPAPSEIPDVHHLKRQIRYIALNPSRARLCRDPLEWLWSSYRDVQGGVHAGWITAERIARAIGENPAGFQERFHRYVTGDPSVAVDGTAPPSPAAVPSQWADTPLLLILHACATTLRLHPQAVKSPRSPLRALFVHAAARQGWRKPEWLAELTGLTRRQVHSILTQSPPRSLPSALVCLGDSRWTRWWNGTSLRVK